LYGCYAEENQADWELLDKQLTVLKRQGVIEIWHNHEILPGYDRFCECRKRLDAADIVLLLMSHHFFPSDLCWELMDQAMESHQAGTKRVIPVLLSPVDYTGIPIYRLQWLPGGKPISLWHNRDEACEKVVKGIRKIVEEL